MKNWLKYSKYDEKYGMSDMGLLKHLVGMKNAQTNNWVFIF